jgi:hypothetical protein
VGRRFLIAVATLVLIVISTARAAAPVAISDQGWTITASPELGTLSISHERGLVLQNVRLSVQGEHGLSPLTEWSVAKSRQSSLTLRTVHPIAAWTFELSPDYLKISNTLASAVISAEAPAPLNRILTRPLDPRGTTVEWVGTNDAMLEYGGAETRNQSFLPSTNPEVMYFAMGLVSASNFHALFDRNTDTLIQFTDQTTLRRSDRDDSLLDVKMPIPGNATIRLTPDYYTKVLGAPFYVPLDDTYFSTAPMVGRVGPATTKMSPRMTSSEIQIGWRRISNPLDSSLCNSTTGMTAAKMASTPGSKTGTSQSFRTGRNG